MIASGHRYHHHVISTLHFLGRWKSLEDDPQQPGAAAAAAWMHTFSYKFVIRVYCQDASSSILLTPA